MAANINALATTFINYQFFVEKLGNLFNQQLWVWQHRCVAPFGRISMGSKAKAFNLLNYSLE
jgi:hypothetical protein